MKYGDEPLRSVDHSRLERVVCAGEVLNAPALDWLQNTDSRRPRAGHRSHVADRDRRSGVRQPVRHRACCRSSPAPPTIPLPGIDAAVMTPDGEPCAAGEKGIMVLKRPFPG